VVLAVNAWDEPPSRLKQFSEESKLSHRILVDGGAVAREKYKVSAVPTNFWIDRHGKIVHEASGFDEKHVAEMDAQAKRIVQQ
jgi:hypothetical protein